ncbi:MAG: HEAT repeat domain-containing protein [Nostoc sp.]
MNDDLKHWLEMLRSPEINDRIVAVKTLQHLGDEETIDALIIALKDENTTVQKIAISAIWEIANPAAIPALIECLSSTDADIRTEAASALNELITQAELLLSKK